MKLDSRETIYAQAFKRLKTIYDEPASFLIQLSNAAFPFELSRDRSVETFEAILNYPSSSPSIISSRISWRISSSFFSFPSPLLFFSVAHRWKLFPVDGRFHRENENKSKLKSKLAGVNCNSISFQLEKRVEAPRTSMELQRGNEGEVARCKTIKRVLLFFFQKTNVVYLFSTSTRGRERERVCVCVCVSSGAALEQRLYTSQSREYALHRMAATCAPVRCSARETSHIFHDRDFIPVRHSLCYIKFILRRERNNTFHIDLRVLKIDFRDDRLNRELKRKKKIKP